MDMKVFAAIMVVLQSCVCGMLIWAIVRVWKTKWIKGRKMLIVLDCAALIMNLANIWSLASRYL